MAPRGAGRLPRPTVRRKRRCSCPSPPRPPSRASPSTRSRAWVPRPSSATPITSTCAPASSAFDDAGGLHRFMGWDGPILTDSGGYQAFSMGSLRRIDDTGITFRSHIDGSQSPLYPSIRHRQPARHRRRHHHVLRPVRLLRRRPGIRPRRHGAHPPLGPVSVTNTHAAEPKRRNARPSLASSRAVPCPRCAPRPPNTSPASPSTATPSAAWPSAKPRPKCTPSPGRSALALPADKPRYLMGVGSPEDLVNSVALGVDMFDCVLPTQGRP